MNRYKGMVALLFALAATAGVQSVCAAALAKPLITAAINETQRVALPGNVRPEATAANDRGRVADNLTLNHMQLQLRRPAAQEQALRSVIDELHDPASPNYHHWLTAAQFGKNYGPAPQDLHKIKGWLTEHHFTVNHIYPSGMLIDFSGTAGEVRTTFHTEIHRIVVKGAKHIANMSDPEIPAALAPVVVGVVSLHDFRPHPMYKQRPAYTHGSTQAVVPADLATIYNLNPLFAQGLSGQGQSIVVIENTNVYSVADWSKFRRVLGLSGYSSGAFAQVQPKPQSGGNNCTNPGVNADDAEAILDAEWASAAAPNATIILASCADTNTTFGGLIALQNLINARRPPAIVSMSYGECETYLGASGNAAFVSAYQQAAAEGMSVFVSAGDAGATACDAFTSTATHGIGVSGFASTPYNVAVGGTDFGDTHAGSSSAYWNVTNDSNYGSAKSYVPEIPWNDSCASALLFTYEGFSTAYGTSGFCNSANGEQYFLSTVAGSGGPSSCASGSTSIDGVVSGSCQGTPKPAWQTGVVGLPNDGVRDLPDVSLFAGLGVWNHYYVACWSDLANGGSSCSGAPSSWSGFGGTSIASPILASIQALVNQSTGARQGNPNYVYYKLAANEYGSSGSASCNSSNGKSAGSSCVFYDITQGDNNVNCTGGNNCYTPSGSNGVISTSNSGYARAFGSTTGWDFATGIGSVNAYNLVKSWTSVTQ